MKSFFQVFPKVFTPAECKAIVTYGQRVIPRNGAVVMAGKNAIAMQQRRCQVRWLSAADEALSIVCKRIRLKMLEANIGMGVDVGMGDFHSLQLTEYSSSSEGWHQMHEDCAWINPTSAWDRKLTAVLQLTPPSKYRGGALSFERTSLPADAFRQAGDLIVFPSWLRHQVSPVTKGTRHSLVAWMYGPPWR